MEATSKREYVSVTDTAKMLREALKRNWPTVKFSVRSKSYAGGASISVSWLNGPSSSMVDAVAQRFHGADFDAMTDSKSYTRSLLVGDGQMREVHFGADFIFCRREVAEGLEAACIAEYHKHINCPTWQEQVSRDRSIMQAMGELSIPTGESVELTAQRMMEQMRKSWA